jgi:DNA-binding MarR family transcriptional regulator
MSGCQNRSNRKKEKNMLEEQMGYHLKRIEHALRMQMDAALREIELTTPQYAALAILKEQPGLSGAALARRCFVTAQTMNAIVNNLEEAGLLVRQPHPEHGRVLQAYITPKGEKLLQEGLRRAEAIEERMMASWPDQQRLQLLQTLQEWADRLETQALAKHHSL